MSPLFSCCWCCQEKRHDEREICDKRLASISLGSKGAHDDPVLQAHIVCTRGTIGDWFPFSQVSLQGGVGKAISFVRPPFHMTAAVEASNLTWQYGNIVWPHDCCSRDKKSCLDSSLTALLLLRLPWLLWNSAQWSSCLQCTVFPQQPGHLNIRNCLLQVSQVFSLLFCCMFGRVSFDL